MATKKAISRTDKIVREAVQGFEVAKLEPIALGRIERYKGTLLDGTVRYFKRCTGECRELLTYESFAVDNHNKDGRYYDCKSCMSQRRRKKQAERISRADSKAKKVCSKCNEEKSQSEYNTYGEGYRPECRTCQNKDDKLRKHASRSEKLGLHAKVHGEGIAEFKKYVMNSPCVLTGDTTDVTLDHIISMNLGGGTRIGNLLPMKRALNSSKNDLPFALWIRTERFKRIAEKYGITEENIEYYKRLSAILNGMTVDQFERYSLWVYKMSLSEDTKHLTAHPTFSEASENSTERPHGFSHDGQAYYFPMVTAKERNEIFDKFDREHGEG